MTTITENIGAALMTAAQAQDAALANATDDERSAAQNLMDNQRAIAVAMAQAAEQIELHILALYASRPENEGAQIEAFRATLLNITRGAVAPTASS